MPLHLLPLLLDLCLPALLVILLELFQHTRLINGSLMLALIISIAEPSEDTHAA